MLYVSGVLPAFTLTIFLSLLGACSSALRLGSTNFCSKLQCTLQVSAGLGKYPSPRGSERDISMLPAFLKFHVASSDQCECGAAFRAVWEGSGCL
jgi:hypothetical protein